MAMQSKAWMTSFLFKEFLSIFKKSIPSENFQSKTSPNSKWAWITCYIRSNCTSTCAMVKNNDRELYNYTLASWVHKSLDQSLSKKISIVGLRLQESGL
jgi:hypothetical protein